MLNERIRCSVIMLRDSAYNASVVLHEVGAEKMWLLSMNECISSNFCFSFFEGRSFL